MRWYHLGGKRRWHLGLSHSRGDRERVRYLKYVYILYICIFVTYLEEFSEILHAEHKTEEGIKVRGDGDHWKNLGIKISH